MSTPFPLHNQSQEMGKKKAVLIGCNYPNTKAELKGCINDVNRIHRSLIDRFGFSDSDITILIDTDPSYVQPTGANVRQAIQDMIHSAESGDYLFMHYSGHGVRLPPETGEVDDTGFDECIVPCDMNLITDDDFRDFVDEVPDGCRITIVSDSCHSGGLIDKLKEQIGDSTKHKEDEEFSCCKFWLQFLENTFQSVFNSGDIHHSLEAHNQNLKADDNDSNNNLDTDHMKNRSLPLHTLIEILKQKTGKDDIDVGKLRPTLFHIFGHDTSPKFKKFMKVILNELQLYGSSEITGGRFMGIIESLPHFLKQKLEEVGEDYAKPALETTVHSKQEVYAGANNKPLPNNGILISGCQTDETSADAYPADGLAYGALSNAIQILLAEGDDQISNKELVLKARRLLAKQGFTQHPGLYCIDDNLDVPFVCP